MTRFLLILSLCGLSIGLRAQMSSRNIQRYSFKQDRFYAFKLANKTFVVGSVIGRLADGYQIVDRQGDTTELRFGSIRSIIPAMEGDLRNGQYWPLNPFNHKYWASPTGFTPGDGQVSLTNLYLLANAASVGVGDHIQVDAGVELVSFLWALDNDLYPPPHLTHLKYAREVAPNLRAGIGLGVVVPFELNSRPSPGTVVYRHSLGYGVITYGNPDKHLSFALYRHWREGRRRSLYSIGGAWRVNPRFTMIAEQWGYSFFEEYIQRTSLGFRIWSKRASFDLAAQAILERDLVRNEHFFRIEPQFGFSLNLSRSKL